MPSAITVSGVSFELPNGRALFNDISFSLETKLTALVGPNGVGKSCLARLVAGELSPAAGSISTKREVTYFPQRESPPGISVQEYLAERYSWSLIGEKLLEGIERGSLCSTLSGGEWMRVRLASVMNDQFLILDEPSNDLDREAKASLREFLAGYPHGILLISHDRELLALCDEILELSNQGLQRYGGGWKFYEEEKLRERDHSLRRLQKAKGDRERAKARRQLQLERQEKRNRQAKRAADKGALPKILMGARKRRAQATTGRVDAATMEKATAMVQQAYEAFSQMKVDPVMYADLTGSSLPSQKLVAEAKGFNVHFDRWLYSEDLNFTLKGNIRLALKGANGSGKSTLIKALLGEPYKTRGELKWGGLRALYLDQRCSILEESQSILENVFAHCKMPEAEIRNNLAKLLFTGESVFQKVSSLSGGERLRAALACGLLANERPELIILDEPTNNLDLANIQFLESLISQFKGAVIIISHDEVFLKECGIIEELHI